jgi:hypothetical protein
MMIARIVHRSIGPLFATFENDSARVIEASCVLDRGSHSIPHRCHHALGPLVCYASCTICQSRTNDQTRSIPWHRAASSSSTICSDGASVDCVFAKSGR